LIGLLYNTANNNHPDYKFDKRRRYEHCTLLAWKPCSEQKYYNKRGYKCQRIRKCAA
jgi:hypothetical protein